MDRISAEEFATIVETALRRTHQHLRGAAFSLRQWQQYLAGQIERVAAERAEEGGKG